MFLVNAFVDASKGSPGSRTCQKKRQKLAGDPSLSFHGKPPSILSAKRSRNDFGYRFSLPPTGILLDSFYTCLFLGFFPKALLKIATNTKRLWHYIRRSP
ncbi:MAG: hypothetical protein JRE07_05615 [Deltaproteobacteria bacterium]|nr:hypothetical protein [Deltaproteobacteria bacterium]